MKVLYAQPEIVRFEWELEVSIKNLIDLGVKDIIILFASFDPSISNRLQEKYPSITIHRHEDLRTNKAYIPSIRPYLWWKFLEANPEMENEDFLYIDSDVIFREIPNIDKTDDSEWIGSDCSGYLSLPYIEGCKNGKNIAKRMMEIIGIDRKQVEDISDASIGAQVYVKRPKAAYWKKVYYDCVKMYDYFVLQDTNLQIWTAEMWSQIWNMPLFGYKPVVSKEFEFAWATDPIENWEKCKIYHNAGVTEDREDLFFKGKYVHETPFNDDLSFVNKDFCSYKYVEAIKKVL